MKGSIFPLSKPWLELDLGSLISSREDVIVFSVSIMIHKIFKTWALIICIAFSPYSSMHHFTPVGPASRCYHFLKENNFDQIICILYNIPNHCSQNSHERLVISPFFGEIQWLLPERNTKPDHQDWDMRHSCDNHIMSCEIRILMKLHCLLCRLEYVILLNKQKHFQIDWTIFIEAVSPFILLGPLTPKNSSWL